jgi:methylase of polypeptide subunit release factors
LTGADTQAIHWVDEAGAPQQAAWRSAGGLPAPKRVVPADDTLGADRAIKLISEGSALLWLGDYFNARHLMDAMERRIDARAARSPRAPATKPTPKATPKEIFHQQRQAQAHRARILGAILLPFDADHGVPLRRAPDVRQAVLEARGPVDAPYIASLRELLGMISAHEWRKKGLPIAALQGDRIHAHYGVFAPVRGEYLELVAQAPLPTPTPALAFDIGTGTGVIAAILARRGVQRVVATDLSPAALACAQENIDRLGFDRQVQVVQADLFPEGRAPLVVCNPPWLPVKPSSLLEQAVYDEGGRMLRGFLAGLAAHLSPGGEGWLILSDLAERLGLREADELPALIEAGGLRVIERLDTRPRHPRSTDTRDPLHAARAAEVTSLWRLAQSNVHSHSLPGRGQG